jgi:hypothetical protein
VRGCNHITCPNAAHPSTEAKDWCYLCFTVFPDRDAVVDHYSMRPTNQCQCAGLWFSNLPPGSRVGKKRGEGLPKDIEMLPVPGLDDPNHHNGGFQLPAGHLAAPEEREWDQFEREWRTARAWGPCRRASAVLMALLAPVAFFLAFAVALLGCLCVCLCACPLTIVYFSGLVEDNDILRMVAFGPVFGPCYLFVVYCVAILRLWRGMAPAQAFSFQFD